MKKIAYFPILLSSLFLFSCAKKTEETKPIRQDVVETVFASGILEAKGTYNLTAQTDGYLVALNFEEGDNIKQGAILATIDNKESGLNTEGASELLRIAENNTMSSAPALQQAKVSIEIAKQKMEQDVVQEQRYRRLLEQNSIAKVDYENVLLSYKNSKSNYEAAQETYRKLQQDAQQLVVSNRTTTQVNNVILGKNHIKAVVSGKVFQKFKQKGDFVKKGDVIATIGDASDIYAKVNIDETSISKVKIGQTVVIQLNTNKEKTYKGIVNEILPSFDDATQSFLCKIKFSEALDFNIINTQLQTNITVGVQKNALLIPRNYLDLNNAVLIKDQKEKTKVTTNFVSNEWVQILSGIDENTVIVTDNIASNKVTTSEVGAQMK